MRPIGRRLYFVSIYLLCITWISTPFIICKPGSDLSHARVARSSTGGASDGDAGTNGRSLPSLRSAAPAVPVSSRRGQRLAATRQRSSSSSSAGDAGSDEDSEDLLHGVMSEQELLDFTRVGYASVFGSPDPQHSFAAFAPGRVNLIGEHTDYNGGFVLPCALERGTVVFGTGRLVPAQDKQAGRIRVASSSQKSGAGPVTFTADAALQPGEPHWCNYVKGAIAQYVSAVPEGKALAMDLYMSGTLPLGGGVSSSASLTVAVATFVEAVLAHEGLPPPKDERDKPRKCQKAEHDFLDTPCGIMDQFAVALSIEGHAMLLDCRHQTYEAVPLADPEVAVVVTDSRVTHSLGQRGSQYPVRVSQCKEAVAALRKAGTPGADSSEFQLCDAAPADLEAAKQHMPSDTVYRRARHAVTETRRCAEAAAALKRSDYTAVGTAMLASHASLASDYEVSTKELDALVEIAQSVQGVYGSRLTGAGFGGCTVTLVRLEAVPQLVQALRQRYKQQFGLECSSFVTRPGGGARVLQEPSASDKSQGLQGHTDGAGSAHDEAGPGTSGRGAFGAAAVTAAQKSSAGSRKR